MRHRSAVRLGIGNERIAAIERNVEPLVAVGRPGIGRFNACYQMPEAGTSGGPQAKRSIHVHPCRVAPGDGNERLECIESAGVDVASLQEKNGWAGIGQRLIERIRVQG